MPETSFIYEGEKTVPVGGRLQLITDGRGLCWGTDAYLLASYVRQASRMCELGSGSGVISLLCALHKKSEHITAIELREDMADISRRSAALNGLQDAVNILCRDIRSVKFTDADIGGRFKAVFANPPYIAHAGMSGADAAANDARHENNGTIDDFCAAAARLLDFKGSFYCVFRPARLPDLFSAMRGAGLEPKRMTPVFPDEGAEPSLVLCEAVLGASPGLDVSRPLIFFAGGGSGARPMTPEAWAIYESCSFSEFLKKGKHNRI